MQRDVRRGERMMQRVMHGAKGTSLGHGELLALQAGVYRYTQQVELFSKVVDKGTGTVRQVLQSQT